MKKILLTAGVAVLFSMAAMAQQQDSAENNQYRSNRKNRNSEQRIDSVQSDMLRDTLQNDADTLGRDAEQQTSELRKDIRKTGKDIENGAERTGNEVKQTAEQAGQDLRQGVERTAEEVKSETEKAGQNIQQGVERTGNALDQKTKSAGENNRDQSNDGMPADKENAMNAGINNNPPDIEVVESKEGPNNEVVYKYQGEMYYVDRESMAMVKADESKLKDTKHKVMVHEGSTTSQTGSKNKKSKG